MKKNLIWILAFCFCIVFLTGCNISINTNTPNTPTDNTTTTESPSNTTKEINYTEVKVSSAKDLYLNIKPNTKIVLTEEYYNTSYIDVATFSNDYIQLEDDFLDYEFIIHDVENLQIVAAPNVLPEIVTQNPLVNVISLRNCNNVTLDGIIAGHEVEKGSCIGGVVKLDSCDNITINNCHLYGCGIYGISSHKTNNVTVNNTEIYECSYGLLEIIESNHFTFNNCTLRDSAEYNQLCFRQCNDINFNNCTIRGNRCWESAVLIETYDSPDVTFTKCVFKDNTYNYFWAGEEPKLIGCKTEDANFGQEYYYDYEDQYDYDYDYDYDEYDDWEPEYDI